MYSVYILRSQRDGNLYAGYTEDVLRRLAEHNQGRVQATKDRRLLELIYCESYKNKVDAMRREKFFKTSWGRNYIKKILTNTLRNK